MKKLAFISALLIAAAVFVSGYGATRAVTYQSYHTGRQKERVGI